MISSADARALFISRLRYNAGDERATHESAGMIKSVIATKWSLADAVHRELAGICGTGVLLDTDDLVGKPVSGHENGLPDRGEADAGQSPDRQN